MHKKIIAALLAGFCLSLAGGVLSEAENIPVTRRPVLIHPSTTQKVAKKAAPKTVSKKAPAKKTVSPKSVSSQKQQTNESASRSSQRKSNAPQIEVGLLSGSTVSVTGLSDFKAESNGKTVGSFKNGSALSISRSGSNILVNGKKAGDTVYLVGRSGAPAFAVKGNHYRGAMKLLANGGGGITVVNVVGMEDYLKGVVPAEIVPSWRQDAIKAQAVAARTYAMYHKNGYRSAGYDVTDDTRTQVYRGSSVETEATNRAVEETAGEVALYGGKPIDAVFHSSGGGYTENSENVWGSVVPYLRGVKEENYAEPWTKTMTIDEFARHFSVGSLKSLRLSRLHIGKAHTAADRGVSGRVKSLTLTGKKGSQTVTGNRMQEIFGLNSTLFDIAFKGKNVTITGYGYGHGLGLSQWGAEAMAEKGAGYKQIVEHYFTGVKVEKAY